jgi:hypothetical protein
MHRRLEYKMLVKKKSRGHLEDIAVIGKMILKQILQEQVVIMRFWFKKLSVGNVSGFL